MNRPSIYILSIFRFRFLIGSILTILCFSGCKETETPENPYDAINNTNGGSSVSNPDPASIVGLHKNIFSPKCAVSGCHDGTFEPDFRTVQSTYASLVYQPVFKTTVNEIDSFYLRVIPFDHNNSFLYERITTNTTEYMPSNGIRLPQPDINNIVLWIDNGAKDENGSVPVKPNLQPNIGFYVAIDSTLQNRYDTIRVGGLFINPFIIPFNTSFYLAYAPTDTLDGLDATPVGAFTNCKIKFSTLKDDFSNATVVNSLFFNTGNPIWASLLNSNSWSPGTIVYFRIYVNDGQHTSDAEFPHNGSPDIYKTIYSFYVQ